MTSPLLFDELIERLRRDGFSVGTGQCLRMHHVFDRFPDATPERLETLLCPLLATSPEEQARFHTAYQEFFSVRPVRGTRHVFTGTMHKTFVGTVPLPAMAPVRRKRWWVAAVLAVVAVGILIYAMMRREERAGAKDPLPVPGIESTSELIAKRHRKSAEEFLRTNRWLLASAAVAVLLSGAALGGALLLRLRRRRNGGQGRPFDWPLRDPHPIGPRLFADAGFFRASRLMKGREVSDAFRLDVRRSVLATIRALGEPVFEYVHDRRVSEYLVLVERLSERDHLTAYVEGMLEALARDGVLLEVFEHDGDPRHCWKPGTTGRIVTADLHVRFPQHRLIIVGSAAALTHPLTGQALDSIPQRFPWIWRAILTPEEESRAARRFEEYFEVYGLAENGLARLVERWQAADSTRLQEARRGEAPRRSVRHLPETPDELETMLGPVLFGWVLRCSVHPTLHWDLTRAVTPPLPAGEHDAALLALVRLEWFREGRIPESVRLALVTRLADDEAMEAAARNATMRVLAAAPPPPASSVAARVFEIQQLGHRIWLTRDQPAAVRPLIRQLRGFRPSHVARDNALMMLLHDAPGSVVAQAAPLPLRRLLFRGGVPAFGVQELVLVMLLFPILALIGNAFRDPDVYFKTVYERRARPVANPPVPKPEPIVVADEPIVVTPPPAPLPILVKPARPKPVEKEKYVVPMPSPEPEALVTMLRTKTVRHPISCKPAEGTHTVNLELTPRETFESVEIEPDKRGLASAEIKVLESGPIVRYRYSFVAAEPCLENDRFATVNIRATLRLAAQQWCGVRRQSPPHSKSRQALRSSRLHPPRRRRFAPPRSAEAAEQADERQA
jgi:hypothetical protein